MIRSPSRFASTLIGAPAPAARPLEPARWISGLLCLSGLVALGLSSYFHDQVEKAAQQEATLGEDAGLDRSGLERRLGELDARIARLVSLEFASQVQVLQLFTRLAQRQGLALQVQFDRSEGQVRCKTSTSGPEASIWRFVADLDTLAERSLGSVTIRAYDLSADDSGRVQLHLELALLTRFR